MWRKDHLLEASDKLEELEAEDRKETEARRILELRAAGGGRNTRRANQAVSDGIDVNTPHTDRVGKFVAEKREWAKGCVEVSFSGLELPRMREQVADPFHSLAGGGEDLESLRRRAGCSRSCDERG